MNTVPYKKILRNNLFAYRKTEKISQKEIALYAKISKDTISLIERENTNVRLDTLEKIASCTGLTISELLTENSTEK